MASRYRLSIEREVNKCPLKSQFKTTNLVNYEPSPESEDPPSDLNESIISVEFLQARLRTKAQIECQLRKKLSDAYANTTIWRHRYQSQADRASHFREELSSLRKRHSDEVAELNRELRWNQKKIKALERVIDENHQSRSPRTAEVTDSNQKIIEANELLIRENSRLSEQIMTLSLEQEEHARRHEQLINELEQLKQDREGDRIDIQNLENAVKALHDENQILKETPIPVVLPKSQPRQRDLGQNLFHYSSSRPTRPCISLIDRRAQEKRGTVSSVRISTELPNHPTQERWPYSSSSEDLSAIY